MEEEEAGSRRGFWKVAKPRCDRRKKEHPQERPCFGPGFFSLSNISSLPRPFPIGPLATSLSASAQQILLDCHRFAPSKPSDRRCLVPLRPYRPMASDKEAANALKLQGNKAFANHDWPTAVDFYNQAIEKYDQEPSFFCNRAQVRPT